MARRNEPRRRVPERDNPDEGTSKPSKKACLGAGKVEMTKAFKEFQDLLNSAKSSKQDWLLNLI
jgi:hypothetical protein